jgi:hypothetical protein
VTKYGAEQVKRELDSLKALMPENGWTALDENDECCFCRKEPSNKSSHYALVDMAHPEPKRKTRSVLFDKADVREGSLMPVQIPCCSRCRTRIRALEFVPTWILLGITLVALIVLSLQSVWQPLAAVTAVLPFVVFIAAVLVGWGVSRLVAAQMRRRFSKDTCVDPLELPLLKAMTDRGWVPLNTKRSGAKVVFLKDRMQQGFYTAAHKM